MWVKKCSELYLSSQKRRDFIFISSCHPRLLSSSFFPSNLLIILVLVQCFFFFYSFSFLHPAVPCSAGAAPPASRQNSSIRAQEKQKMAVAGCPDYFLHHPNYQVSGHLLSDFFFYVLIIDDVIDCVFLT